MAWEEFLPLAREQASADDDPRAFDEVARVEVRIGRHDDARATWKRLAERYPRHDERPEWRVRAAMFEVDVPMSRRLLLDTALPAACRALTDLAADARTQGDAATLAHALTIMGRLRRFAGADDEAVRCFDAAIAAAPGTRHEPTALWDKAESLFRLGEFAASRSACQRILGEFPASREATLAPDRVKRCDEMLR
jgi:TolA-binding protein